MRWSRFTLIGWVQSGTDFKDLRNGGLNIPWALLLKLSLSSRLLVQDYVLVKTEEPYVLTTS